MALYKTFRPNLISPFIYVCGRKSFMYSLCVTFAINAR